MQTNEEEEEIRSRLSNRADPFLVVCKCFSVVTALIAILCVVVNVIAAVRSFRDSHDVFDGIFRCFGVLVASLVVLAETEWSLILKFSKVLKYWAGRGMLQIFAAVMTRAFPEYMSETKGLLLLQNIASYMLLACGVIYVLLGVLCIGCLKRARQKKQISREQVVKDLEENNLRRAELEHSLVEEHPSRDDGNV